MLNFIALSDEMINIQVSGTTPEIILENIVKQIKDDSIETLAIEDRSPTQIYKPDNVLYNQQRYFLKAITTTPIISSIVLDPDNIVD